MRLFNKYLYDFIALVFINLFSIIAAFWVLGFSPSEMNVPWVPDGDLVHSYTFAQNIKQSGSFGIFSNLAWPYISDLTTFPTFYFFEYSISKILTLFVSPIFAVNLYVIFTFPLLTTFTYILFRKFGFSVRSSSAFSLMLALIPWHFQHAVWHVNYANYLGVPLTILVIHHLVKGQQSNPNQNFIKIIFLLLLTTTLAPYFWLFTQIILFVALGYLLIFKELDKNFRLKSLILFLIIPFIKLTELFILKSQSIYVSFSSPVERDFSMVERYSGSFMALLMPNPNSALPFFGGIRNKFDRSSNLGFGEGGPWNSWIGILAIIFTVSIFIYFAVGNKSIHMYEMQTPQTKVLINILLLSFVVTLLFYWTTGLGSIFYFFISDWVRSWGRLYIYLIYFAFIVSALLLRKSKFYDKSGRYLQNIILGFIFLIFIFDQVAKPIPNRFEKSRELYEEISEFSNQLSSKIDPGCAVLQLPIMRYPAGGVIGQVTDYEHFFLYLTNPNLKYSYGSVSGTQQDSWQEKIETKSVSKIVSQAAAVGYCAAVVDFRGYESTVETGNAWIKTAGKPIAVSKNTRLAAFKIYPQKSNPAAVQSLLTLTWKGKAESGLVQGSKQIDFSGKKFELYALNPTKEKINGDIKFGVRGSKCDPVQELTIRDSNNILIFQNDISKTTQQISLKLALEPRAQSKFTFELSSSKCNIEWYSDALISVRNERFILN